MYACQALYLSLCGSPGVTEDSVCISALTRSSVLVLGSKHNYDSSGVSFNGRLIGYLMLLLQTLPNTALTMYPTRKYMAHMLSCRTKNGRAMKQSLLHMLTVLVLQ